MPACCGSATLGRLTLSVVLPSRTKWRQLVRHEVADVGLRLLGGPADVRGEDDVRQAAQLGDELVAAALRLLGEHVDRRAGQVAALKRLAQRDVVDDEAAGEVEEDAARAHPGELLASPKKPALPGRPSTCRVTTSPVSSSSSRLAQRCALPSASLSAVS